MSWVEKFPDPGSVPDIVVGEAPADPAELLRWGRSRDAHNRWVVAYRKYRVAWALDKLLDELDGSSSADPVLLIAVALGDGVPESVGHRGPATVWGVKMSRGPIDEVTSDEGRSYTVWFRGTADFEILVFHEVEPRMIRGHFVGDARRLDWNRGQPGLFETWVKPINWPKRQFVGGKWATRVYHQQMIQGQPANEAAVVEGYEAAVSWVIGAYEARLREIAVRDAVACLEAAADEAPYSSRASSGVRSGRWASSGKKVL